MRRGLGILVVLLALLGVSFAIGWLVGEAGLTGWPAIVSVSIGSLVCALLVVSLIDRH